MELWQEHQIRLTTLLQTSTSDNLLLYPHNASKPSTAAAVKKTLQEDKTKVRAEIHQNSKKLCLVRVLLHALLSRKGLLKKARLYVHHLFCRHIIAEIQLQ